MSGNFPPPRPAAQAECGLEYSCPSSPNNVSTTSPKDYRNPKQQLGSHKLSLSEEGQSDDAVDESEGEYDTAFVVRPQQKRGNPLSTSAEEPVKTKNEYRYINRISNFRRPPSAMRKAWKFQMDSIIHLNENQISEMKSCLK